MVLRFFILAVAFLLSCTSIERDSVCDEESINYNGCVGGSSSSGSIVYGEPVIYESETYETVLIGTQTWMARNLNYSMFNSGKCYGEGGQVYVEGNYETLSNAKIQANCNKYGRLYNWTTAMALPEICNTYSCVSQIKTKHQGICPRGWHIPNNDDWKKLVNYVERSNDCSSCAARYLKATSGWEGDSYYGNGEDKYGFSALPGGSGIYFNDDDGGFGYFHDDGGSWWSASEGSGTSNAYSWYMPGGSVYYKDDEVSYNNNNYGKDGLLSVRCLQD
ncbi:MAG: fibrobacter succinogenes major paralogous domain-containing protein [Fibromonadaceae bacterium]|jgi:uncharacterized protein (TIGR02145 family)|nr:fibrobacter succinogenes major paralogous domain-containing protein [Fibromonadaceae bacterium]